MKELSDLTAFSAGEKGLELTLFTEEGIPDNLIGDPLRLGQVLLNLVSNAIKFTEAGEIVVSARPVPRSDDRVEVIFTVSDTGIGISRETIPRLFESFSQADGSTTRKFGGTGLGLAICKHLVELMGGTITVQSTPSQGTTFSFTALFGVQDRTLEPPRPSPDLLGTRTLVVEDNRTTRKVLVHMLESFGFQVTEAASGQAALLAVELAVQDNAPFQLVILDWKMPGLDGIQTSQAIRRHLDKDSAPHMLMVSAHAHEELDELAERAGIGLALAKPVHRSALFNAIMESFGHRKNTAPRFRQETIPDLAHVQGARILVVEDNEINRQVIRELLEQAGMLVEEAPDGEKALNILDRRDHDVDLVLLDIEMPGMNGYETCTRLRKRAFLSDLPVLAMTAHAMQEDRDKSMAAGMNDHLTKPIDPDAVYKAIARWVPAGKASEEAPPGQDGRNSRHRPGPVRKDSRP
jgi:CheY-like chemotaxis protein